MEHIARAFLSVAAFIELSGDDVVDPDSACNALEEIAVQLQRCTEDEIALLRKVLAEFSTSATNESEREFFKGFLGNFGIGGEVGNSS